MMSTTHGAAKAIVTAALLAALALVPTADRRADGAELTAQAPGAREHWIHTWTAMPQLTEPWNLPPEPYTGENATLVDTTLRQTLRVTTGGSDVRVRLSNAFGGAPLPITWAAVARPLGGASGVDEIEPGSSQLLTFSGRQSTVVPVGAQVVSDPVDMPVDPLTNLTLTLYLAEGQQTLELTSHPGSRTTSYLLAGDHLEDASLEGAAATDHWYLASGVEVSATRSDAVVAVLGDSLTDGRGSTTNGNNRWPDVLAERLKMRRSTAHVAVVNQAAGGNRVLQDGLGPNVMARLDRDILSVSGVRWLIVFEGVNDIGVAEPTKDAQEDVAADLVAAYEQVVVRAHAQGIDVVGATLLPFGGNEAYDDPDGHREAARQAVNGWIRTSGVFDRVLDFDAVVRDPQDPTRLNPAYDDGDGLHLNPAGYEALAESVPLRLFGGRG